jgi:hypothetical protein
MKRGAEIFRSLSISGGELGKKLGGNSSFAEPLPPIADSRLAYV